ncbi:MAG: S-methyl-5'-thioadenosine phosphorylase [Candidatus Diapherotrites archaeon]|mgnify:CR=1|jgi:5'-methylthioadenosine phosphorylase|nr:S-methyl-5'-thioadenosine phosphorylase [Candidatus Diapherotrites archaeon]
MIGIIGGSGLEDPELLHNAKEVVIKTPYGTHSPIKKGEINGISVALMSRHGYKHEYSPSEVPYKANIFALKEIGCKAIIAASACGSLREDIEPKTLSFPTQFIDRTTKRDQSYCESNNVIHESMADPFNNDLRMLLTSATIKLGFTYSTETTVVTIEGPRFSTRAESELFRNWGADLINMTTVPEACLAKELKIPYQVINLVTDYDSWHESKEVVTFEMVMEIMKDNAEKLKKLVLEVLPQIEKKFS